MKNSIISRFALLLPIFIGFAFTAKAIQYTLTMTEVSSTTLNYSWNGPTPQSGTVTAGSSDNWVINLTDNVVENQGGGSPDPDTQRVYWQEPLGSSLVNSVLFEGRPTGSVVTIKSDATRDILPFPTVANGGTYDFSNNDFVNFSGGNLAIFNDNGDSSVPDGGTTVGLLGMGLIGLAALGKRDAMAYAVERLDRFPRQPLG